MWLSPSISVLASTLALIGMSEQADDMGPAAFVWPPDRPWATTSDNSPPCGSSAGVSNRTEFPMTNGAVAIVLQDESYRINLAISYSNNPTSNADFMTLVSYSNFPELDPGHECYSVPNSPSGVTSGTNATLQLSYVSEGDTEKNNTYYACADITYVELNSFTDDIPCFNVSTGDSVVTSSAAGVAPTATGTSAASSPTAASISGKSSHNGLSGAAIAGVVVGVVAGSAVIGTLVLLWRRREKKTKWQISAKLRMDELTKTDKNMWSTTSGEH